MKSYISFPSITNRHGNIVYSDNLRVPIIAFDKLDGSQIRAEFSIKKGFYKFGTKNRLVDETDKQFGESVNLIKTKYEDDIRMVFEEQKYKNGVLFFEFYGKSSFAGRHLNEEHTVTLFDASPFGENILEPKLFLRYFGHLDIPKVVYKGVMTVDIAQKIYNSEMEGVTSEGVVCKGNIDRKTKLPIMFKVKTKLWYDQLVKFCDNNVKMIEELE